MPVGNYNFDAQSHQQLYDKIHRETGAGVADATNNAWLSFRAVMGNARSNVESAVRDAKATWTGSANESFSGGMAPLVQWAENARAAGVDSHNAFLAQRSHYSGTKERMPEPVQVTSTANDDFFGIPAGFTHLVGGQTDQDVEEQRANEAKREAVRMMTGYQGDAGEAVSNIGTFTPPPTVTLDVPAPTVEQSPEQRQYGQEFNARSNTADIGGTSTPSSTPSASDTVTPPPTFRQGDQGTTHLSDAVGPPMTRPEPLPVTTPTPPGSTHLPPATGFPLTGPLGNPTGRGGPGGGPMSRPPVSGSRTGSGAPRGFGPGGGSPRTGGPSLPGQSGQQPGGQFGRGTSSGVGDAHVAGRPGAVGAGARGGAAGVGMGGASQRGQGEDDIEHKSAEYLQELGDVWGENDVLVAPPVIGDDNR
ncbi:MAG TPA: hypothetical protein VNO31_46130 [Umezawaea sp.]|nr:hypothetical protein [Umezawaea sp.]